MRTVVARLIEIRVACVEEAAERCVLDDMPPANPDGVVESTTCLGQLIDMSGREPDAQLTRALITRYDTPYHNASPAYSSHARAGANPGLPFDDGYGSESASDTGRPRPLLGVGNLRGAACATATAERFAAHLRRQPAAVAADRNEPGNVSRRPLVRAADADGAPRPTPGTQPKIRARLGIVLRCRVRHPSCGTGRPMPWRSGGYRLPTQDAARRGSMDEIVDRLIPR